MRSLSCWCCLITIVITSLLSSASSRRGVSVPNFSIRPPMLDRGRIHYKTTYACEGNPLHLNCEDGHNIHLVRANYGRFSLSICNDGGRLDLSVNCMSYRSFLIMQDRCSQKSNCSVIVSSKIFGDPCPGTLKYLEVQYHCVHGGTSSATTTRRPPIMLNIPILSSASSNTSSLYHPPGQPSTISSNEDVIVMTTEASNNRDANHHEGLSSSPSPTVSFSSSTTESTIYNHIEKMEPAEHLPKNPFDNFASNANPNNSTESQSNPMLIPEEEESSHFLPTFPPPPPPLPPGSFPSFEPNIDGRIDFCPPIFVRSLFWNWTRRGESAVQKCPGGATGSVRWDCKSINSKEVDWIPERPDFSECRSLWLDNLKDRLYNGDPVIRIANELALMTLTKALFSEDLKQIAFIVQETLARAVVSLENLQSVEVWHRHQVLKELLMFIVETASNLLDNAQDDAWLDLSLADRKRIASKLLEGLEESALLLADNTNQDGSFTVAKPNVLVSVHVLDTRMPISLQFPTIEDTRGTNEWIRMEDSLFLPAQSLLEYSTNGFAKAVFLAYYRIEDLLKPDTYTMHGNADDGSRLYVMANKLQNLTSSSLAINSRVIGASFGFRSTENDNLLQHPVTVVLRHIQEENISSPRCVYWHSEKLDWLSDGCWLESTNATHSVCMCKHLSHYALLMDVRAVEVMPTATNWQRLIAIIGCAVTLLSLAFITVILAMVSGNAEAISIHRNLCVTLLITELAFLFGVYRTDLSVACGLTAGVLHFFLLSALLWTFFESFDLYYNLIDVYDSVKSSRRLIWYYIIAYVGPSAIVLISICIDPFSYGTANHCWLRVDNYFCFSFVGPAIGIIFGGLVFVSIACYILFNNSSISTSIKGIEEVKFDSTKSGVKWVTVLLLLQCITWTFGLIHVNLQTSTSTAVFFAVSNIILGLFMVLFCIFKIDNIQHLKLMKGLPFLNCFDDVNCVPAKSSVVHGDSYHTRPVVTQVTPTQVPGIVSPSSLQSLPQQQVVGPIGPSSPTQITSFLHQQWNSPQEKDNCSNALDRPFILAQQERDDQLLSAKAKGGGTTGPILVNPINDTSVPTLNVAIGDITAAAMDSQNLADYQSRLEQIRNNSLSRMPKMRRKMRHHGVGHLDEGTRYAIHPLGLHGTIAPHLYNQYLEHIYESIDSDSLGSGVYEARERHVRRSPVGLSQINDFYAGANVTVTQKNIADDECSQNSSSSYGPLYDDRPLLVASQTLASPNLNHLLVSHGHRSRYHQSNLNVYHSSAPINYRNSLKSRGFESGIKNESHVSGPITTVRNICGDRGNNKELPDLVQYPIDSTDNVTTVLLNQSPSFGKSTKDSRRLNIAVNNQHQQQLTSQQHHKLSTYC